MYSVGIDIGGTFTDITALNRKTGAVRYGKVLTTPGNLTEGVVNALDAISVELAEVDSIRHGTTVVINALLERKGRRAALVTTEGFRDVLEIGRANRPITFDLFYRRLPPLVPRTLRFEVGERMASDGRVIRAPVRADLARVAAQIEKAGCEAVAISFLNSYANSVNEDEAAAILQEMLPGLFVTTGTTISRQWYEYERTATAVANAYVGPIVADYLDALGAELLRRDFRSSLHLMGSAGGAVTLERARAEPINLIESGPVGGAIGVAAYCRAHGIERAIAFDVGGTTAKCALVENGDFEVKPVYYVSGYDHGFPIRAPVLDIVEIGTGGGSIGWIDDQGRLRLGPHSASSKPGPACYGLGGVEPTVTDANLLLGRISAEGFRKSAIALEAALSEAAFEECIVRPLDSQHVDTAEKAAEGLLQLATADMAAAIRRITIERGQDPRDFVLFAYGGGGPLHATDVARALNIGCIIVPPNAGMFSAFGMLLSDMSWETQQTTRLPLDDALPDAAEGMFDVMRDRLSREHAELARNAAVGTRRFLDIRYKGQTHPQAVEVGDKLDPARLRQAFDEGYAQRFGHAMPDFEAEVVGLRLVLTIELEKPLPAPKTADLPAAEAARRRRVYYLGVGACEAEVYDLSRLPPGFSGHGPAVIEDFGSSTLVDPEGRFEIGAQGEIIVTMSPAGRV